MKKLLRQTIRYIRYKQLRALFSALYHGHPSREMTVIGVTGTDGKTTTCALLHHILQSSLGDAVFVGTTGAKIGKEVV